MKVSQFTQELYVAGSMRSVSGKIVVTMNHTTENYQYNNPSTHESEPKSRSLHKVVGYINGSIYWENNDVKSEESVITETTKCKHILLKNMESLGNSQEQKSFVDKMKELGFK